MKSDAHKGKVQKGDYGFLFRKKKEEIIRTAVYFGISLLVFLVGFFTTKTKANYLTIVAVLGCLPASKSAVSAIMYGRIRPCSQRFYKEWQERYRGLGSFHLYFTTYNKNFPISHLYVKGKNLIAFTEVPGISETEFEEHIQLVLGREGKKGYHVKLYNDEQKYFQRMEQLLELKEKDDCKEEILRILHCVSL